MEESARFNVNVAPALAAAEVRVSEDWAQIAPEITTGITHREGTLIELLVTQLLPVMRRIWGMHVLECEGAQAKTCAT